jgi:hypothetical protein
MSSLANNLNAPVYPSSVAVQEVEETPSLAVQEVEESAPAPAPTPSRAVQEVVEEAPPATAIEYKPSRKVRVPEGQQLLDIWSTRGQTEAKPQGKTPEEMEALATRMQQTRGVYKVNESDAKAPMGVFPKPFTNTWEQVGRVYPNTEDPEFARKLYRKKEFYNARAKPFADTGKDQCSVEAFEAFTLTPIQRLVSRFMDPRTPYYGLLIYHGVGVGKTLSAVTIGENFLAERPSKRVHIICPKSITTGFLRTIFDDRVLRRAEPTDDVRYVKNGWYSAQGTGTTYLELAAVTPEDKDTQIISRINKLKKRRYRISGYLAFKLAIDKLYKVIPATITNEEEVKQRKRDILRENFNDGLIIIDEAHNLRQDSKTVTADELSPEENPDAVAAEDGAEAKAIVPVLLEILQYCEGVRLVLMTATPMFNTAPEIIFLLNLLILNDTKQREYLKKDTLFDKKGFLTKPAGHDEIVRISQRYVSYMRGENPFTFPIRLRPAEADVGLDEYPLKTALRGGEDIMMTPVIKEGIAALPIQRIRPVPGSICELKLRQQMNVGADAVSELATEEAVAEMGGQDKGALGAVDFVEVGLSKNVLDSWTQIGNITYKNQLFGKKGWEFHFKTEKKQVTWNTENPQLEYGVDDVFNESVLEQYAPKIAKIVNYIHTSKGINFVYSRYVQPGALPLCIALERAGYTRVNKDGEIWPLLRNAPPVPIQCALCPRKQHAPDQCPFRPARYVLLTSDYTTNLGDTIKYATTFTDKESVRGGNVKVIVGSMIAGEGLDLKCIRELHVMDPWYHLNRLEQIIGRGVRYCSHGLLPPEQRNCLIRLYALYFNDVETSDMYSYRVAVQKAKAIGLVQRALKIGAWDCNLNYQGIQLSGSIKQKHIDGQGGKPVGADAEDKILLSDKDNSSMCDYMECSYKCHLDVEPVAEDGSDLNTSTFTVRDARAYMLLRESALRELFERQEDRKEKQPWYPLDVIKSLYKGLPDDLLMAALPTVLNNPSFELVFRGQPGYLILRNNYVVFQPKEITDTQIPMALRYRRVNEIPAGIDALWQKHFLPTTQPLKRPTQAGIGSALVESASTTASTSATATATATAPAPAGGSPSLGSLDGPPLHWIRAVIDHIERSKATPIPGLLSLPPSLAITQVPHLAEIGILIHRFRNIEDLPDVLGAYGLDYFYSHAKRQQLLTLFMNSQLPVALQKYIYGLRRDTFADEVIQGYFLMNKNTQTVETYCIRPGSEKREFGACPSSLSPYVDAATQKNNSKPISEAGARTPTKRIADDYGRIFAVLAVQPSGLVQLKSVQNTPAGAHSLGADCIGSSNKTSYLEKIRILKEEAAKYDKPLHDAMFDLNIFKEESGTLAANRSVFKETVFMKKQVLCIYFELLCRLMDKRAVGGKRWFMNLVELKRSLDAPASQWPRK